MDTIEFEMLTAPPEQGPNCELVDKLNCLLVHYKFQTGKTTRKSRRRIIRAIVRAAIDTKTDESGRKEEDQFGIIINSNAVPEGTIAAILTAIKVLPDFHFGEYNFTTGFGNLYLMNDENKH